MGEMRDSDWSRANLLRSDWLPITGAIMTTDGQYEQNHQVLLKSEVETLRCSMFDQVCIPFTCLPVSPFDGFRYGWMDGWWNE